MIGGYAVGYYATPRFTKDLDLLVDSTPDNLARVYRALASFGAPSHVLESLRNLQPGEVLWMGNPPVRVDILQRVDGVDFEEAYQRREQAKWKSVDGSLISRQDLIASKKPDGLRIWLTLRTCLLGTVSFRLKPRILWGAAYLRRSRPGRRSGLNEGI